MKKPTPKEIAIFAALVCLSLIIVVFSVFSVFSNHKTATPATDSVVSISTVSTNTTAEMTRRPVSRDRAIKCPSPFAILNEPVAKPVESKVSELPVIEVIRTTEAFVTPTVMPLYVKAIIGKVAILSDGQLTEIVKVGDSTLWGNVEGITDKGLYLDGSFISAHNGAPERTAKRAWDDSAQLDGNTSQNAGTDNSQIAMKKPLQDH